MSQLQPKRVKHRKVHKGRIKGIAQRGHQLAFGTFGLKVLENSWITSRQMEAVRVSITRTMKREGIMWFRIFPDKPITEKPIQTRMGSGKGSPCGFVAVVRAGRIICELEGVKEEIASQAFYLAGKKLPIKTKMVVRDDYIKEGK